MFNFLSPTGFRFILEKAPIFSATVQNFKVPSVSLGTASSPSQLVKINNPGNIVYEPITCTFKITENLENYNEILNWMKELGHPENYSQYKRTQENGVLLILNSKKNTNKKIEFTDVYPINIDMTGFDATDTEIQYLTGSVTFQYTSMLT